MNYETFLILNKNPYLKKYLRENSFYYKDLSRNHHFINKLNEIMKSSYKLNFSDRLEKVSKDIDILNTMMDIIK